MKKESKEKLTPGKELFENYLNAKNELVANMKRVITVLIKCNALDVNPNKATESITSDQKLSWVSSHQWQYSEGHEAIWCQHTYKPSRSWGTFDRCTIKVPLNLLGMTDKDIYKLYGEAAIKELEAKRDALQAKLKKVTEPLNDQIANVEEQMNALMKTQCT